MVKRILSHLITGSLAFAIGVSVAYAADVAISALTAQTGAATADDDVLAIVDTSATQTNKITAAELGNKILANGATPAGAAGGDLGGSYPNPSLDSVPLNVDLTSLNIYSVTDDAYGAINTGGAVDNSTAFQDAHDACNLANRNGVVVVPPGDYVFDSGFDYYCPMIGLGRGHMSDNFSNTDTVKLRASGTFGANILINVPAGVDAVYIEKLHLQGIFLTGSTAIDANQGDLDRYVLRDVLIRGWGSGAVLDGFIGLIENVFVPTFNTVGFDLTNANGVTFVGGECSGVGDTGSVCVDINSGRNIQFFGTVIENAGTDSIGVNIDEGVQSVSLYSVYFENPSIYVQAGVGGTGVHDDAVAGLYINASYDAEADGDSHIILDNVHDIEIVNGSSGDPVSNKLIVTTTALTRGLQPQHFGEKDGTAGYGTQFYTTDDQADVEIALSMSPDPNNAMNVDANNLGLWDDIDETNVAVTQETTITGKEGTAYRITKTGSSGYPRLKLSLPRQDWLVDKLVDGVTVWGSAWVYVPSDADFEAGTYDPSFQFSYRRNSAELNVGSTTWFPDAGSTGKWAKMTFSYEIDDNGGQTLSDFSIYISPTQSDAAGAENKYIIVRDIQFGIGRSGLDSLYTMGWTSHSEFPHVDKQFRKSQLLIEAKTLQSGDCGSTIFLTSATEFATTLPTPIAGCKFDFVIRSAPSGASYTVVTDASANILIGGINELEVDTADDGPYDNNGDTITFVDGVSVVGDFVKMQSDGASWYISGQSNADGGITVTGT